ncbi:hypothetical protein F5880DRAFT_1619528 [Lentinula raphanica]|nr:hypothetical protein F5880DRAFT_1619528 [Lentinula raphanica]
MAHSLRPDIPSRRARNFLSQVAPGMADLNPAPGVGRGDPPPPVPLDQAPAGSFQANRALNGEQGVAARQRARLRHSASSARQASGRDSPSHGAWDPDAFPTDLNLFGTDSGGHGVGGASQQSSGGGESPPRMSPHSTRVCLEPGLEGGGATFPRGRGPLLPTSPASTGSDASSDLSEWGGVEGEFRVAASPALEPPFQLRPALSREPQFTTSAPQSRRDQVEQFRSDSRSQRRREHGDDGESPTHVKQGSSRVPDESYL